MDPIRLISMLICSLIFYLWVISGITNVYPLLKGVTWDCVNEAFGSNIDFLIRVECNGYLFSTIFGWFMIIEFFTSTLLYLKLWNTRNWWDNNTAVEEDESERGINLRTDEETSSTKSTEISPYEQHRLELNLEIVLSPKYNFVLRVFQIAVIGVIMILEILQFIYYNAFFVNLLRWPSSHYFSSELKDVYGLKNYYTFVILFTWVDSALYIGLFHKFRAKSDSNVLNIISDLFFTSMWLSVCLTNIIPYYKSIDGLNCPNYKFYSTVEFSDFRSLCQAYFGSMISSWIMFFLFSISSIVSWRAYYITSKELDF
ncbi:hypothetical protein RclHR1_01420025 [Rhizophagus clarus]|uniref:MARVEL domain-containing protein n=1 Tax=Rhizophagus clarus TaxID=94130 RepID=A0A2Z6QGF2_9GLOM|nr:hypothetical protein RclHR1_01420025 [Rhizophagus clarus]